MDNARRRRGRPAVHVGPGPAPAGVAGLGLPPRARALIVGELALAIGSEGSCAGQAADLSADPSGLTLEDLEGIHARKTGALFVAAVRTGALAGGAGDESLEALTLFARNLGLA